MPSILDQLQAQFPSSGMSPIQIARAQLKASPGGCWPIALQTLKSVYDANTAREAWVALLSEPNSGWSTYDPRSGTWTLYCVPGYDALCGDSVENCPLPPIGEPQYLVAAPRPYYGLPTGPAGQAVTTTSTWWDKVAPFVIIAGILWFVYMMRPESEEEKRRYATSHHNRRQVAA
ncbi:MAG: hypothetical protein ABI837_08810 [Acidobacteriota bacterium]